MAAQLKLSDLSPLFSLSFVDASKRLGVCQTSLKKICRKLGLARWPQRRLRHVDKRLAAVRAELSYTPKDAGLQRTLQELEAERERIFAGNVETNRVVPNKNLVNNGEAAAVKHVVKKTSSRPKKRNSRYSSGSDDDETSVSGEESDGGSHGSAGLDALTSAAASVSHHLPSIVATDNNNHLLLLQQQAQQQAQQQTQQQQQLMAMALQMQVQQQAQQTQQMAGMWMAAAAMGPPTGFTRSRAVSTDSDADTTVSQEATPRLLGGMWGGGGRSPATPSSQCAQMIADLEIQVAQQQQKIMQTQQAWWLQQQQQQQQQRGGQQPQQPPLPPMQQLLSAPFGNVSPTAQQQQQHQQQVVNRPSLGIDAGTNKLGINHPMLPSSSTFPSPSLASLPSLMSPAAPWAGMMTPSFMPTPFGPQTPISWNQPLWSMRE